jgi:hypothetical protein
MSKKATQLELFGLVDESEMLLRETWDRRCQDRDILVLCDLRREEVVPRCTALWGQDVVDRTLREATGRPMLTCLQSPDFPDVLEKSGDPAHAAAAGELRGFANLQQIGIVPLLVVIPGGLWATPWAPPKCGIEVIRVGGVRAPHILWDDPRSSGA